MPNNNIWTALKNSIVTEKIKLMLQHYLPTDISFPWESTPSVGKMGLKKFPFHASLSWIGF